MLKGTRTETLDPSCVTGMEMMCSRFCTDLYLLELYLCCGLERDEM